MTSFEKFNLANLSVASIILIGGWFLSGGGGLAVGLLYLGGATFASVAAIPTLTTP